VKIVKTPFALFVTILLASFGVAVANGATPTPVAKTPTTVDAASPTPVQTTGALPAAPSGAHIDLRTRRVTWLDNSNNESGFRVTIRAGSTDVGTFAVATDTTSFDIPVAAFNIGCGQSIVASIVAFNNSGSSAPSVEGVAADCGPSPTSVPPTTPRLPDTGAGRAAEQSSDVTLLLSLLGSSMLLAGLTLLPWPTIRRRLERRARV
jgi:hypothetical protein